MGSVFLGLGAIMVSAPAASDEDLLAKGRKVFEETAGEIGCAYCHGAEGKGNGIADVNAANIQGLQKMQIQTALGAVEMMDFISLSDEELEAVSAYVQQLGTQQVGEK